MKKIILFLVLVLFYEHIDAQSASQNFNKYWFYRDRLKKRFLIEGNQQGQSIVVPRIERKDYKKTTEYFKFHHGDQTIQHGWYLGVLATEYNLLAQQQQSTTNTERELYYAMKAYERLDENAEVMPGYTAANDGLLNCSTCTSNLNYINNNPTPDLNGFL